MAIASRRVENGAGAAVTAAHVVSALSQQLGEALGGEPLLTRREGAAVLPDRQRVGAHGVARGSGWRLRAGALPRDRPGAHVAAHRVARETELSRDLEQGHALGEHLVSDHCHQIHRNHPRAVADRPSRCPTARPGPGVGQFRLAEMGQFGVATDRAARTTTDRAPREGPRWRRFFTRLSRARCSTGSIPGRTCVPRPSPRSPARPSPSRTNSPRRPPRSRACQRSRRASRRNRCMSPVLDAVARDRHDALRDGASAISRSPSRLPPRSARGRSADRTRA